MYYGVLPRLALSISLLGTSLLARSAESCTAFPAGQDLIHLEAHGGLHCFRISLPAGTAEQFTIEQPVDLELDVRGSGLRLRIDGFEFGTETATFTGKGQYRIQIVGLDQPVPRKLIVSRKRILLQDGARFRQAENFATEAKQNATEGGIIDSLNFWTDLHQDAAVARTHLKLGDYHHHRQSYGEARAAYQSAADVCERLKDLRCRTEALNNVGLESEQLADFDSARMNLEEAASGWQLLGNRELAGRTLANLGLLYRTVHEYRQALSFDKRAARALERSDREGYAKVLIDFGLCYQALAEYRTARVYFEQSLRVARAAKGAEPVSIRAEIDLGKTLLSLGRSAAAALRLSQAKKAADLRGDRAASAGASNNLAQALLARGLTSSAEPLLQNALRLHLALGDQRFVAADRHVMGIVALKKGKTEEAKAHFAEAASLRLQSNLRLEASDSLFELARLEFRAGNIDSARDLSTRSLDLMEAVRRDISSPALRASFSSARRRIVDLLIQIEVSGGISGAAEKSFLMAERGQGRAMLDLLAESDFLTPPPPELQEQKASLERRIGLISSGTEAPSRALRDRVAMLTAEFENVDAEMRAFQPERRFGHPLDSVEQFRKQTLPPQAALLEFHLGEPQSYLWLVTSTSLDLFTLPSQKEVERHSAEFISLFADISNRKRSPEVQKRFNRLSHTLSREILGALKGKELPQTLIVVCDGALNRVPLEALMVPGETRAIGLTHNLIRAPSAGYLEAGREVRDRSEFPKTFLGVVDPVFSVSDPRLGTAAGRYLPGPELPRLPFTMELEAVNRSLTPSRRFVLRGLQANKRRLEELDLKSYAFVHFSTHAIIDDTEPELSRVALSLVDRNGRNVDGYVHPSQFSEWHLSGSTVVLSACETALGKQLAGEGFWGVTAALFKAGASQLVLTLSAVDSEGSSEFFNQVYQNLFGAQSCSMEMALTKARRSLASSARWSDPYYWAPFVVVGRPMAKHGREHYDVQ